MGRMTTGIKSRVEKVIEDTRSSSASTDPLVHIAWLVNGLDLYHRSGGTAGYTLDEAQRFVVSTVLNRFGEPHD